MNRSGHAATGALAGLRVWLTRPEPHDEASAAAWSARGADVQRVPTLSIEPRRPDEEDVARVNTLESGWVVLPSPRAARNLAAVADAFAVPIVTWPAAVVGEATAVAAREVGFAVKRVADRATGADLAEALVADASVQRVVLASSDRRREELGETLRAADRTVVDLVVHWTMPRVAAPSRAFDCIALYSPSALNFLDELDPAAGHALAGSPAACLGATTASAARERGFVTVLQPDDPGEDALLDRVGTWWDTRRSG